MKPGVFTKAGENMADKEISLSNAKNKYGGIDIEQAIENALRNEVAEVVKGAIAEAALQEVYEGYTPSFLSRRDPTYGGGQAHERGMIGHGITDPDSVVITVSGNELIAEDNPDWQQLWGDRSWRPAKRLAEAIADGDPRYNMDRAGPRPFHDTAKALALETGAVERALREGLKRQGIDVTGLSFEIT